MKHTLTIAALAAFGLAGCTLNGGQIEANSLTTAEGALTAYASTPNPSQAVITQAKALDAAARTALTSGDASAEAKATAALLAYLLTSAPGAPGLTSTIPTAG